MPANDPPPGKYYEVSGRNMHLYTAGKGEVTVVFASGWGTPNPYVDFSPLYDKLKSQVKIAVYDRFGYGYSDYTDDPRDVDTISEEIHQLLRTSGQRPPYINGGNNQQWLPIDVGGYVVLANRNSGLTVDINQGSLTAGASTIQWAANY